MSFFVTYTSKKTINKRLKTVNMFFMLFGILNLKIDSMQSIHIKPPSSIGNGIKLNKAKLIDNSPKKKIKLTNPTEAALAEYSAIFIGPPKDCFIVSEFFAVIALPIVLKKLFVVIKHKL